MKYAIIGLFDEVGHQYVDVSLKPSSDHAIRDFDSSVIQSTARKEGILFSHPSDFALYHLGDFDSVSGEFDVFAPVVLLRRGGEVVCQ